MARPQLSELSVEVQCKECGRALEAVSPTRGVLNVEPCQDCLDNAYAEGEESGRFRSVNLA